MEALRLENCWSQKPLLDGRAVMETAGCKGGPVMKAFAEKLVDWQLANPEGTAEQARAFVASVAGAIAAGAADGAKSAAGKISRALENVFLFPFAKTPGNASSIKRTSTTALATPRAAPGADAEVTYPRTVWRSHPKASARRSGAREP